MKRSLKDVTNRQQGYTVTDANRNKKSGGVMRFTVPNENQLPMCSTGFTTMTDLANESSDDEELVNYLIMKKKLKMVSIYL